MTNSVDELSQKVKDYLTKLLIESQKKIKKLKKKEIFIKHYSLEQRELLLQFLLY